MNEKQQKGIHQEEHCYGSSVSCRIKSLRASELLGSSPNQGKADVNGSPSKEYIQDAGIKMCFAYFGGMEAEKRKVQFGKQLNVLGAVGGIDPQNGWSAKCKTVGI